MKENKICYSLTIYGAIIFICNMALLCGIVYVSLMLFFNDILDVFDKDCDGNYDKDYDIPSLRRGTWGLISLMIVSVLSSILSVLHRVFSLDIKVCYNMILNGNPSYSPIHLVPVIFVSLSILGIMVFYSIERYGEMKCSSNDEFFNNHLGFCECILESDSNQARITHHATWLLVLLGILSLSLVWSLMKSNRKKFFVSVEEENEYYNFDNYDEEEDESDDDSTNNPILTSENVNASVSSNHISKHSQISINEQ